MVLKLQSKNQNRTVTNHRGASSSSSGRENQRDSRLRLLQIPRKIERSPVCVSVAIIIIRKYQYHYHRTDTVQSQSGVSLGFDDGRQSVSPSGPSPLLTSQPSVSLAEEEDERLLDYVVGVNLDQPSEKLLTRRDL